MLNLGPFLQDLRKEHGYTQQEVADFLKLSNKTISKWERSEGYPELESLIELAKLYHISVDEILQGERKKTPSSKFKRSFKGVYYGLFIISLLIFYLVYFAFHDFVIAFLVMMIVDLLSFITLYYGIMPHLDEKSKSMQFKDGINFYLCRFILIVPCYNFMIDVPELMGKFPMHLTFSQYFNPWFIILLGIAFIIYAIAKALYTQKLKRLIFPFTLLGLWGIIISITLAPLFDTTTKTMNAEQYEMFKSKYIFTYQSYYEKYPNNIKKLPNSLLRFNSFGFNRQIKDSARYIKYRYIIGFDDAQFSVIYRASDEVFLTTIKEGIKNTYHFAWLQIGFIILFYGLQGKFPQLKTYF